VEIWVKKETKKPKTETKTKKGKTKKKKTIKKQKKIIYLANNHLITILLNNYMILKIDNREHDLISNIKGIQLNKLAYRDIKIQIETLPLGDIIIADENDNELLIIERKTVNDLLSSIRDGRYEEQSHRLNGSSFHNHNIIYLIEGDIQKTNRFKDIQQDKTIFYSSLFSLNYYKGFSVLRTFSIEETALFICNTAYKLKKSKEENRVSFYNNINSVNNSDNELLKEENEEKEEIPYVNVVKKVKKENITPQNIGEIMLSQIPGISAITAIAIMKQFKTLPMLIEELVKNEKCLENISYFNSKGNAKKINKTSIKNIFIYLVNNKMSSE